MQWITSYILRACLRHHLWQSRAFLLTWFSDEGFTASNTFFIKYFVAYWLHTHVYKYFPLRDSFGCYTDAHTIIFESVWAFFNRAQPCWFALHQGKAEKDWLVTYLIPLPRMPAMFMTSVILKMAATGHGCVFATSFFNVDFNKQDEKSSEKPISV